MDEAKLRNLLSEMWKEMHSQFARIERLEARLDPIEEKKSSRGVSYGARRRNHPEIKPKHKKKKSKPKSGKTRAKSAMRSGKSRSRTRRTNAKKAAGQNKKRAGYFSTRGEYTKTSNETDLTANKAMTGHLLRKKGKKRKRRSNTVDTAMISKFARKKSGTGNGRLENLIARDRKASGGTITTPSKKNKKKKGKKKAAKKKKEMMFSSENPRLLQKKSPSRNKKKKIKARRAASARKKLGYESDSENEDSVKADQQSMKEGSLETLGKRAKEFFLAKLSLRRSLLLSQEENSVGKNSTGFKEYGEELWKSAIDGVLKDFDQKVLKGSV